VDGYESWTSGSAGRLATKACNLLRRVRSALLATLARTSVYLRQFHLFRELTAVYRDYRSWLEEIHFSRHLDETLGGVVALADWTMDSWSRLDAELRHSDRARAEPWIPRLTIAPALCRLLDEAHL